MFRFILSVTGAILLIGAAGANEQGRATLGESLLYALLAFALFGVAYLIHIHRKKASK